MWWFSGMVTETKFEPQFKTKNAVRKSRKKLYHKMPRASKAG
jgi:hypothetical protein